MFTLQCMKSTPQKINFTKNCSRNYGRLRRILQKFLLLTNSLSAGACMVMGDLVEQEFEFRSNKILKRYDWKRAGHMFVVGTVLGTYYHFYYTNLERFIPKVTVKTTAIKILLDQTLVSPITLFTFYCGMDYLEGKPFEACEAELKKKFLKTFTVDCMYWPPVQFINFYFLPISYRVLYVNVTTMIYNIFLSYMKHNDASK